jgi:tRNA (guanine37-N1)-methyltransferase
MTWHATVVTLFPEMFPGPLGNSISGKALQDQKWKLDAVQPREYATDRHKTVDDTPYGGGAGMVIRPDIIDQALTQAQALGDPSRPMIYLTPRGKPLVQSRVHELAASPGAVVLCGRYEGVDHRVIEHWGLEEISIGDYILSGGEIPTMVLLDACVRLLPGVVGKEESLFFESFELGLLEYPQYTRPQVWKDHAVPEVLLSGDHGRIARWREEQSVKITMERRPDLWDKYRKDKNLGSDQ